MNRQNKKSHFLLETKIHYYVTMMALLATIFMTFLPIISWNTYHLDKTTNETFIESNYCSYFDTLIELIHDGGRVCFMFGMFIVLFYLTTILTIVYIIAGKRTSAKIYLTASALLLIPIMFSGTHGYLFARTVFIEYLVLLLILFSLDMYFKKALNRDSSSRVKKEMVRIGNLIRDKRKDMGLTQQQLADRLYVSRTLIAKYETGQLFPNRKTCEGLSQFLSIDISEFEKAINYENQLLEKPIK